MWQQLALLRAFLWEWSRFSWWRLLNAQLAVLGIAVIVYLSLAEIGPLEPRSGRTLHMVLLWMQLAASGGAALIAAGDARRFYLLPLPNSAIACAMMIPGCLSVAASYALTGMVLNWTFDIGWPIMGPTLFVATLWAGILAATQLTRPHRWRQFCLCSGFAITMAVWLTRKYGGGSLLSPNSWWLNVTTTDAVLLGTILASEYGLMIAGIRRERCGLNESTAPRWIALVRDRRRSTNPGRFRTAFAALWWSEWQQKGWLIPSTLAVFAIFLLGGYELHAYANRDYELLHSSLGYGIGLIPLGLVFGLILGHSDLSHKKIECGVFTGSLPATNEQLAKALLGVEAFSLVVTWLFWVIGLGAATWNLHVRQGLPPVLDLWTEHGRFTAELESTGPAFVGFLVLMTLSLTWIGLSMTTTLVLTGRQRLIVSVLTVSIPTCLAVMAISSRENGRTNHGGINLASTAIGILAIATTVAALMTARRVAAITRQSAHQMITLWVILSAAGMVALWRVGWSTAGWLMLACGLAGLAVSPLATAPLALSWNRHR